MLFSRPSKLRNKRRKIGNDRAELNAKYHGNGNGIPRVARIVGN